MDFNRQISKIRLILIDISILINISIKKKSVFLTIFLLYNFIILNIIYIL